MADWELRACRNDDPVQGLASLPDRSVGVVCCDPPYSEKVHTCSRRSTLAFGPGANAERVRDLGFAALTDAERTFCASEFARVARRWVMVFCDHEGSDGWRDAFCDAGLEYVRTCVWIKEGCTPQLTGDRPAAGHECIVVAHQTKRGKPVKKRWNAGGKRGVYTHTIMRHSTGARVHTTQKPLRLILELVSDFTEPGELVCDPYAGSGTTGVACRALGRRFIGWESDTAMAEIARRRIAGDRAVPVEGQMEMF